MQAPWYVVAGAIVMVIGGTIVGLWCLLFVVSILRGGRL